MRFTKVSRERADMVHADLDVGSGSGQFHSAPRGRICVDLDIPTKGEVPTNFIRASAFNLPFRDKSLHWIIACNLLEHLPGDPRVAIDEMLRVGNGCLIKQDKIYSLHNYRNNDHRQLQLGHRCVKYPRTRLGLFLCKMLWNWTNTRWFGRQARWIADKTFKHNFYFVTTEALRTPITRR